MVKNKIMWGKTKEHSGIRSCAPLAVHVITLLSNPLLYWLRYLDWWNNIDKGAIYSGKYWVKHEHKTLRFIKFIQIGIL